MKAYIFPGQGSQFPGMGKELYECSKQAKGLFEVANETLGFRITDILFEGAMDDFKQTKITQPAIYIHSVIRAKTLESFKPDMAAGHSLGEFSALATAGVLSFEDGLRLVYERALAMQDACEITPSSMAAILGLKDKVVEEICEDIDGIVVPANYNCPGQLVISGETTAVKKACETLRAKGAKRTFILPVSGAFHSPLMEPARKRLLQAIEKSSFKTPDYPIYQNVTTSGVKDPEEIKKNLIAQLTAPVKWRQSIERMIADGTMEFIETGPGQVLQGLVKKINKEVQVSASG
ncbi:MAG: ACP S-malonyltransferase [Flavobacteriales bacterium Tduv]